MMSNEGPADRFVEVGTVLYALAKLLSEVQQAVDRKSLDLARHFRDLEATAFSLDDSSMIHIADKADACTKSRVLPLSSLISFRRYRISELLVDFAVVAEDHRSDMPGGQTRLRVVPLDSRTDQMRLARFKVVGKERVVAEFQIAGEIKATVYLGEL